MAEGLPAKGATRTVFDNAIPSFAVRISPEGLITFVMIYSSHGQTKRFSIGRYRTEEAAKKSTGRGLTAAEARRQALVLRARIESGEDIAAAKTATKEAAKAERERIREEAEAKRAQREANFGALMTAYVAHLQTLGKNSWREVENAVRKYIINDRKLSQTPAVEITVDTVMPVFHALSKAGKLRTAEKLRAYLRAAFNAARKARTDASMHAFTAFKLTSNPLEYFEISRPKEAVEKAIVAAKLRKRALSAEQLAAYWRRITAPGCRHGELMQLHLLTGGQRVAQLARATTADLDPDFNSLMLLDTKGRRKAPTEHLIPLIDSAFALISKMNTGAGPYLFTINGGASNASYSAFREAMSEVSSEMVVAGELDRPFTPGIIRKTVETRLQAAGISKEVRGHLLSHGRGGVQAVHYEAYDFFTEKKQALELIRKLCDGQPQDVINVVPIRRQA